MKHLSLSPAAQSAPGGRRYKLERCLGRGGMGAVHLAWDAELGEHVALKQLSRIDAEGVVRLKREFRALSDITHPNLVKLYDLASEDDAWFFTMEYVDGLDMLSYVRRGERLPQVAEERRENATTYARLFHAFHQLASGVHALHRAGKLHLDLKPANVMVTRHRVVILDFGMVHQLGELTQPHARGRISGTPEYMAPEQIDAEPTAAADWYALGTMLYEALTGQLPFHGSAIHQLLEKQRECAPSPRELVPDVPSAIDALCVALLSRDPDRRPAGAHVLACFEAHDSSPAHRASARLSDAPSALEHNEPGQLLGRQPELDLLEHAFASCRDQVVAVHVHGMSGAGKTALVEAFLRALGTRDHEPAPDSAPLVLRGRCYEREAVPFKALDAVVDALSTHLGGLSELERQRTMPEDSHLLGQLFPTLSRFVGVHELALSDQGDSAALLRRHAARALSELLSRLAVERPIVIWIDDLQWGDVDSASLLRVWLEHGRGRVLCILSYRADETQTSDCLRRLLSVDVDATPKPRPRFDVAVEPLDDKHVRSLIRARLGEHAREHAAHVQSLAEQARGNPFLAVQLSALLNARLTRGHAAPDSVSAENLLSELSELLAVPARELLTLLAVAGRPLQPAFALASAGVREHGRAHVHALRALNLVRTRDVEGTHMLEVYHDRVREGVLAMVPEARLSRVHRELLRALEQRADADPYWLYVHAAGAKHSTKAYRYAREAADRAVGMLAFDRAERLYRECLSLVGDAPQERVSLLRRLGDTLTRAGRGVDAAHCYLEAAGLSQGTDALLLKRLAASHLVRSGSFAEGESLVAEVLSALDARVPTSDPGLVLALGWERLRLALRGLHYEPRTEQQLAPEILWRIDTFHALREETTPVHPLRSALFQARQLRLALAAGEPKRVIAALCGAALSTAVTGTHRAARETDALLERAAEQAATLDLPLTSAVVTGHRAVCNFMLGRFETVREPAEAAERMFLSMPGLSAEGWYFQRLSLAAVRCGALASLGEYQELRDTFQKTLLAIRDTDNRGALLQLAFVEAMVDDISGHTERTHPRLLQQANMLPEGRFSMLHVLHMMGLLLNACATERFAQGLTYLERDWRVFVRSPSYRVASFRSAAHMIRAQLLLNNHAVSAVGPARGLIDRDLDMLHKTVTVGNLPHRLRYQARLAFLAARPDLALARLRASTEAYEAVAMRADAARNRYAIGRLLGGDEGKQACEEARAFLTSRGLVNAQTQLERYFPELHR